MSSHSKKEKTTREKVLILIAIGVSIAISVWLWSTVSEKAQNRLVRSILRLIPTVGIATFIGTVVELRNWLHWMKRLIMPLVSFAKLPLLSGASMITSLFSNKAAASIISGAYEENRIARKSLITTGMCNSHFAYLSHSVRVLYPVTAAAGLTGLLYFGIQFSLGFLIIFGVLILHRVKQTDTVMYKEQTDVVSRDVPSWKKTLNKAGLRTTRILLRLLLVTVPMYLFVLYLTQKGVFKTWNALLPDAVAKLVTVEMMTVAVSMMGGLINAATLAGEMLRASEISSLQILFAMLLGSALGNPVRTIRRNLPSAMGIYPPKEGFMIVSLMQCARFITVIGICLILMLFMQ